MQETITKSGIVRILMPVAQSSPSQRFRKLTDEEKEVGKRIALCRRREALSQSELASKAGISRDQLARIENGRAMVPMGFALQLAQALQINLRWLAKGTPPAYRYVKIPQDMLGSIDFKGDFLPEFNATLTAFFDASHQEDVRFQSQFIGPDELKVYYQRLTPEPENLSIKSVAEGFWPYLVETLKELPPDLRGDLRKRLEMEAAKFKLENEDEIRSFSNAIQANTKSGQEQTPAPTFSDNLDNVQSDAIIGRVRLKTPTWPDLKRDVLRFTTNRGDKTALANKLGVSRQVFGNWLSDGSQGSPNADLTLQLLRWVEEQKKLQK